MLSWVALMQCLTRSLVASWLQFIPFGEYGHKSIVQGY